MADLHLYPLWTMNNHRFKTRRWFFSFFSFVVFAGLFYPLGSVLRFSSPFDFTTYDAVAKSQLSFLPPQHQPETTSHQRPRFAYVTLSYGEDICPPLTVTMNVRNVLNEHSKYAQQTDVIILRLGELIPPDLMPKGVQQRPIQETVMKGKFSGWKHTYSKFWIARMDEYDAVLFLDSDVLLYKDLDDLIDVALNLEEGSIVAPRAYWYKQQPTAMTGTFVIRPCRQHPPQGPLKLLHALLEENTTQEAFGLSEMDWFNHYLVHNITLVSGFYTLLTGEFYSHDGAYAYWQRQRNQTAALVLQDAPLIHFISRWKPWKKGIAMAKKNMTEQIIQIYKDWNQLKEQACPTSNESNGAKI